MIADKDDLKNKLQQKIQDGSVDGKESELPPVGVESRKSIKGEQYSTLMTQIMENS